ncbi:N-acetylglucosamine-6-phosphate deacetylase [soil metagenome]|jgi:N-acetylglucosamine-6-phosphate deacetylase|nr:N-acetylglucosamine-6-phosphate deacetylase [Acidobacteriota bacterium]
MKHSPVLLKNAAIISQNQTAEKKSILIQDNRISQILSENEIIDISSEQVFDLQDAELYAGFIDIHNHGAIGIDVNNANADDLHKASKFLAAKGVTAWLPTLVPDTDENYAKTIKAIDQLMQTQDGREPAARVLGVHYEGPFVSEKMCGALRTQFFKSFKTGDEVENLPKLKNGIHLTTLAPEVENGIELIKELRKQDWIVSIGHTKADFQTLENAFNAGAKHLTHFFNAMTGLHHREIGVVGWGLAKKEVTFDIIADGVHVHPQMLKFAFDYKTSENLILISDSVSPTGLGDGDFEIWGEKISVAGGKTQNERGSIAGSVITMLDAFKMFQSLGVSPSEISKMASLNPARLLGREQTHGSIKVGKRADLVAIDEKGNIKLVLIGGEKI